MNKQDVSIGTWLTLYSESIAELLSKAGYNWITVDLEHSAINISQAEKLIRVIDLAGSKPFVRVSENNSTETNDKDSDNFYLEFGVFSGTSINFFSKNINKNIYGFDSFEGLKEDWLGTSVTKGTFDLKKKIPKLNINVIPISGWVQDTLPKFLDEKKPKINFVHMDIDTYESSKFVLENIKPFLIKGAIILFDELYNFEGWDVGEYKALTEVFDEKDYSFVSFSTDTSQAAIKILN